MRRRDLRSARWQGRETLPQRTPCATQPRGALTHAKLERKGWVGAEISHRIARVLGARGGPRSKDSGRHDTRLTVLSPRSLPERSGPAEGPTSRPKYRVHPDRSWPGRMVDRPARPTRT